MLKINIPENWAEPPPPQDEGNFFTLDLSISCNFQQLWFLWQKSPPLPHKDDNFHRTRTSIRYERLFAGNANPSSYNCICNRNVIKTKITKTKFYNCKNSYNKTCALWSLLWTVTCPLRSIFECFK